MSVSIAVTDGGEVRMAVSTSDATMNVNMKPAYARWLASEILAGADRADPAVRRDKEEGSQNKMEAGRKSRGTAG